MTMRTLPLVTTPLLLFLEADTPLLERPIDWAMLKNAITSGETNHIRFHLDEQIHPDHQFLMDGKLTPNLIKTRQWSQRPHLSSTAWYKSVLNSIFTPESRCFIEDRVYTFVAHSPWESYRLTIYDPEGTGQNMKRSGNLDGRGAEQKYGMTF